MPNPNTAHELREKTVTNAGDVASEAYNLESMALSIRLMAADVASAANGALARNLTGPALREAHEALARAYDEMRGARDLVNGARRTVYEERDKELRRAIENLEVRP